MEFTGWERLWIVLSVLLGLPSAYIAHDAYDSAYVSVPYSIESEGNEAFWKRAQTEPKLAKCIWPSAKARYWQYDKETTIQCDTSGAWGQTFMWFLIPGGIMWVIGSTIGWIIRGFRK